MAGRLISQTSQRELTDLGIAHDRLVTMLVEIGNSLGMQQSDYHEGFAIAAHAKAREIMEENRDALAMLKALGMTKWGGRWLSLTGLKERQKELIAEINSAQDFSEREDQEMEREVDDLAFRIAELEAAP